MDSSRKLTLDKLDVADVFSAKKGGGNRTVLLYLPGGAGNKLQGGPNGDVFYDNIGLWGTKNGMVVVRCHGGELDLVEPTEVTLAAHRGTVHLDLRRTGGRDRDLHEDAAVAGLDLAADVGRVGPLAHEVRARRGAR